MARIKHLRSALDSKRPIPAALEAGELALNYNQADPGIYLKAANGSLVKVSPTYIGNTPPNATPALGGESGNCVGESWLDTSGANPVLKIWDGTAWIVGSSPAPYPAGGGSDKIFYESDQVITANYTVTSGKNAFAVGPLTVDSGIEVTVPVNSTLVIL